MTTLAVIAKAPVPGKVKTRLCPPCTPVEAAALAEAALADTLAAVRASRARRRVLVLQGQPGPWLPTGLTVLPQRGGGLDERLAAAFDDAFDDAHQDPGTGEPLPALLIGMDTPQVTPELLDGALEALLAPGTDAVLGAAADGGWWALGLRRPDPGLLVGVPMSTAHTGAVQRQRLDAARLRVTRLATLRDVDTTADAAAVAAVVPGSTFAATLAVITADAA
jgi:rSAM/selenodomain-associated transferase 1